MAETERRNGPLPARYTPRLLLISLCQDISWGLIDTVVNGIAASPLVPRILRFGIYRAFGLRVRSPNIAPRVTMIGQNIHIGGKTFVNRGCFLEGVGRISIGADSLLAMDVRILTTTHDRDARGVLSAAATSRSTTIGDRCWLGAGVTVLPGVTITDDVTVGAGAVVVNDLAYPGVYAGVPARPVRRSADESAD